MRVACVLVCLLAPLAARASDEDSVRAATAAMKECKGYRVSVDIKIKINVMGLQKSTGAEGKGVYEAPDRLLIETSEKGQLAVSGDRTAMYSKERQAWVSPSDLDKGERAVAELVPALRLSGLMPLIEGCAADAKRLPEARKVHEVDCAVYEVPLAGDAVTDLVGMLAASRDLKKIQIEKFLTKDNCSAKFTICVDEKDSRIHWLQVTPSLGSPGGPQLPIGTITLEMSEHDQTPPIEFPPGAEQILDQR